MPKRGTGPRWSGSICYLPTQKKVGARVSFGEKKLDLAGFTLASDTLLMQAIAALEYPASAAIIHKFTRAIRDITLIDAARDILDSPLADLDSFDIARLFSLIEDVVEKGWGKKSLYSGALSATSPFKKISIEIGDGRLISESGFASRFPTNNHRQPKESAAERPLRTLAPSNISGKNKAGNRPSAILDSTDFNTFEERNKNAFEKSAKRHAEIAKLCELTFAHHREVVIRIKEIKERGRPEMPIGKGGYTKRGGMLSRETFLSLSDDRQLQYLLYLSEIDAWHEIPPCYKINYQPDCARTLFVLKHIDGLGLRKEILLSDHFLPEHVVGACCVAIQNASALNSEVIESMSDNDVVRTKNGYRLVGIKGRTDQVIEREIFEKSTVDNEDLAYSLEVAHLAVELLLANAQSIKQITQQKTIPLLSTMHRTAPPNLTRKFHQVGAYKLIRAFCRYHQISAFDTRYLRELKLQTHSLSPDENIYTAQQLAGHTSPKTTEIYTLTKILSHLQMANIRRYMDMLAASILWRTNRQGILKESGLEKRGFNLNLLFPIEDYVTEESSAIDSWIASGFRDKISIGKDELAQCSIQFDYYQKNIENLPQDNPKLFIEHHLPRLLICVALHYIFLASQFAPIYRKIRREIHAAT